MKYNTGLTRIKSKPEINNGPVLVEFAGYVSKRQRIDNIIRAGERLIQARKEMYDYTGNEKDPDIPIDPTRSGNYDLADASEAMRQLTSKGLKKAQEQPKKAGEGKTTPPPADQKLDEAKTEINKI